MMDLRHADAVADVRLAEAFVRIGHNMRRVNEAGFPKPGHSAAAAVSLQDPRAEHCLMQALLDSP
jgi:hypothetical protein